MYRTFSRGLFGVVVLWLLVAGTAQAQTLLRWKFAQDQRYTILGTQRTEVVTSVSGKAEKAELETNMELTWQVEAVDEAGTATMKQAFTRLAIKTTAPGADPVSFDSASATKPSAAAKEIAASVKPLLNVPFQVKMSARGEVQEVTLSDQGQKALEALPANSQLKDLLSPAGLTQLFRLGGSLPEQEVKPSESWTIKEENQLSGGVLNQETTFTLAALEEKEGVTLAQVSFAGNDKFFPDRDAVERLKIQEQTRSGEWNLNLTAGYVTHAASQLVSKSQRNFRDLPINITIDSKTQLQIKRQ